MNVFFSNKLSHISYNINTCTIFCKNKSAWVLTQSNTPPTRHCRTRFRHSAIIVLKHRERVLFLKNVSGLGEKCLFDEFSLKQLMLFSGAPGQRCCFLKGVFFPLCKCQQKGIILYFGERSYTSPPFACERADRAVASHTLILSRSLSASHPARRSPRATRRSRHGV